MLTRHVCLPGFTYPEYSLPDLDGNHRRCQDIPPSPSYGQGGFHACHEGQLDHLATCFGVCPEVLTRAYVGSLLQHRGVRDWNLYQCTHQKEEAGCIEKEGMR